MERTSNWPTGTDDAVVRLGLALYRETKSHGVAYYNVHNLVFDHIAPRTEPGLFGRVFSRGGKDFWGTEGELAKQLAQLGIADHFQRPVEGERFLTEHLVKLTSVGRKLYDLAVTSPADSASVEGLSYEDALTALSDERMANEVADSLEVLGPDIDGLHLSNFDRATVDGYTKALIVIARMPDPDVKVFWIILDRLNQFAGVASLIVAIIALRLAK